MTCSTPWPVGRRGTSLAADKGNVVPTDHAPIARPWLLAALALLALAVAALSIAIGPADLGARRTFAALTGHGDAIARAILFDLRLPRAALALLVGAILGLSGASL